MSYSRNILSNFSTQLIKIILGFIISIIIARKLGPEQNGIVTYILMIFAMIGNYGNIGINNAAAYFQNKSTYSEEEIYSVNITFLLIIFSFFSIGIFFMRYDKVFLNEYNYYYIILGLIYALATLVISSIMQFYIGNEKIIESNKYIRNTYFIQSALIILFSMNKLLNGYTYLLIVTVMLVINAVLLLKNSNIKLKLRFNTKLIISEFKYGIVLYLGALLIFLNYRIDQFLIKNMLSSTELGIYSIGVNLAELVFLIPENVASAFIGKLYNINSKKDEDKTITSLTIKYVFYLCSIIILVGFCCIPLIPLIYGVEYKRACSVTGILFIGVVFAAIGKVAAPYFYTKGKNYVHLKICCICFIINVVMNLMFIPYYGINGAAIASTISYIVYGLLYIFSFVKLEGFLFKDFFMLNKTDKKILDKFIHIYKAKVIR